MKLNGSWKVILLGDYDGLHRSVILEICGFVKHQRGSKQYGGGRSKIRRRRRRKRTDPCRNNGAAVL
jgi:hypothetical protein